MKKPEETIADFKLSLNAIVDKEMQVRKILAFSIIYGDSFGPKIIPILEEGIHISKEIGYVSGEVICYYNLAFFNHATQGGTSSIYQPSMAGLTEMIEKLKGDTEWYVFGLNLLSYFHWFRGEYEKSFNLIFENLKISGGLRNEALAWNYFALAVFYFDTRDFENSILNHKKALELFIELGHNYGQARSKNGLATIAILQNRIDEAIPLLEYSAEVYRKIGHHAGLSRAKNDMGLLEKTIGNYDKAIEHLNESVELRLEIDHIQGLITSYTELGETYLLMKKHGRALEQFEKGLSLAHRAKSDQKQMRLHKLLYDTYKKLNNTALALQNFEIFYELKTKLMSDEASNSIKKIQSQYEKEKLEKETEIERLKNVELKKAHDIIEQKNKDILDSIRYAKRIQTALMSNENYIHKSIERLTKKD